MISKGSNGIGKRKLEWDIYSWFDAALNQQEKKKALLLLSSHFFPHNLNAGEKYSIEILFVRYSY